MAILDLIVLLAGLAFSWVLVKLLYNAYKEKDEITFVGILCLIAFILMVVFFGWFRTITLP